jgi:hypothetical protein
MIGAGVFAAFGPAARAAGNGLLVGLAIAALVAYCNATSSASSPRSTPNQEERTFMGASGSVSSRGSSPAGASSSANSRAVPRWR